MNKASDQKSYKKLTIFLIVLFGLIFSLSFFLKSSPLQNIRLGITTFNKPVKAETNVPFAVNELMKSKEVYVEVENDTCYWIKPTFNETGSYLDILKYDTKFGECVGTIRDEASIPLDEKFVMYSPGCLCNGRFRLNLILATDQRPTGLTISKV